MGCKFQIRDNVRARFIEEFIRKKHELERQAESGQVEPTWAKERVQRINAILQKLTGLSLVEPH
jgi:hypothetical protein